MSVYGINPVDHENALVQLAQAEADGDMFCAEIAELKAFIRRLLDPEDLGMAVPAHVHDEARAALGMPKVET